MSTITIIEDGLLKQRAAMPILQRRSPWPCFGDNPMTEPFDTRSRRRLTVTPIPGWAMLVSAIIAGALGIGLFLLSASLLLLLAPVVVVIFLYYRWRIGKALREAARHADTGTVDAEYRVISIHEDR
jgi:hypothetical protein